MGQFVGKDGNGGFLFIKQISMGAGAGQRQHQHVAVDLIDEQPNISCS